MLVRVKLKGGEDESHPYHPDLPTYTMVARDFEQAICIADVPVSDIPDIVVAFLTKFPVVNLFDPFPVTIPASVNSAWRDHLARYYDYGYTKWNPQII